MAEAISDAAKLKACELHHALSAERAERIQPRVVCPDQITWDDTIPSPMVTLARYIQQVSDAVKACGPVNEFSVLAPFVLPEPVNPLLIEAREIVAGRYVCPETKGVIQAGEWDKGTSIGLALAALKRGMELARAKHDEAKTQIIGGHP